MYEEVILCTLYFGWYKIIVFKEYGIGVMFILWIITNVWFLDYFYFCRVGSTCFTSLTPMLLEFHYCVQLCLKQLQFLGSMVSLNQLLIKVIKQSCAIKNNTHHNTLHNTAHNTPQNTLWKSYTTKQICETHK